MIKRTLAVLVTTLAATAALADPPVMGSAPPPRDGLLDDLRVAISEIVVDIRDGLGRLVKKPRDETQCRPGK